MQGNDRIQSGSILISPFQLRIAVLVAILSTAALGVMIDKNGLQTASVKPQECLLTYQCHRSLFFIEKYLLGALYPGASPCRGWKLSSR